MRLASCTDDPSAPSTCSLDDSQCRSPFQEGSNVKIDRVELREMTMQLREPFEISSGVTYDRRVLLLTLHSDGLAGWSECVAGETPGYSYETTATAWSILTEYLLPGLPGIEIETAGEILEAAAADAIRGHQMAKASVEMAASDLEAKAKGISLATLIGGTREAVPVGVSIGLQPSDEELHRKVGEFVADGYARIKVKIKPGRDVEMLMGLREKYPDVMLMADANSAFSLEDLPRLKALDEVGLMMIEQPLAHDDYLDHARLQEQIDTPVCLDESIRSVRDVALAIELGSCRIINIKPGRVGGIASSKAIHDLCSSHGMPVWCGGMLESGVGRAHNVALATLPGFTLPGDISASRRYWSEDIVTPEFEVDDGTMRVPEGPGIGVDVREQQVEAGTVRKAMF